MAMWSAQLELEQEYVLLGYVKRYQTGHAKSVQDDCPYPRPQEKDLKWLRQ